MFKKIIAVIICFIGINNCIGQDTLPNFSAQILGINKAQISWQNPYPNCTQISVQKSYDSLRFFKTIFSPLSPELPVNGFVDNDYLHQIKTWYRIQYVLEDGSFYFTNSKIPANSQKINLGTNLLITNRDSINNKTELKLVAEEVFIKVFKQSLESLKYQLTENRFKLFKDSISTKTKDTLYALAKEYYLWKPYVPIPQWKPSLYIYTNNSGSVSFDFPKHKQHYYRVVIYNTMGKEIFRIKQIKTENLVLEKGNFLSAGWFNFEIFEDEKLKEKNKFYLNKDF